MRWILDPTRLALDASTIRRKADAPQPPGAFCLEVGRRLLLAELDFSGWVLRRVEKVEFQQDRSVLRQIAIDIHVRDDAPVFVDRDDCEYWLVPISMMRRRTLVNLDLRDEQDRSITTPGIRLQQQLDQSILLAAAATTAPDLCDPDGELRALVAELIAGEHDQVEARAKAYIGKDNEDDDSAPAYLRTLQRNTTFAAAFHRLRRNFSLYAFLPVKAGRHRLLRMSFDEPIDWVYQRPQLGPRDHDGLLATDTDGSVTYKAGAGARSWEWSYLAAMFGLRPTRIRFQVPSAENAASYHFELTAPDGVRIVQAGLLAGRPNDPKRHVSTDHTPGHGPTIGLHAVEVPNGSLCRAQVDLRVSTRGWLTTSLISCWLIFAVLLSVVYHLFLRPPTWSDVQVTNVVLLLVSASGGVATLIAQRDSGALAARLVGRIRALGAMAIALPIIGAGFLIYPNDDDTGPADSGTTPLALPEKISLSVLTVLSLAIVALSTTAWVLTWLDERKTGSRSPWNMTGDSEPPPPRHNDFRVALRKTGFDTPAVGVKSSEGWHERYAWDDDRQNDALAALDRLHPRHGVIRCVDFRTSCALSAGCAAKADARVKTDCPDPRLP
jgi:hypothetical protein